MADRPAAPEPQIGTGGGLPTAATYPGTPRWVKLAGIVALILVLAVVALIVATVLGLHSPGGPAGHGV